MLTWFRMLIVSFLLRTKQTNDATLNRMQEKSILSVLPQRLLILTGSMLQYWIERIRPNDRTESKPQQHPRVAQQKQFVSR